MRSTSNQPSTSKSTSKTIFRRASIGNRPQSRNLKLYELESLINESFKNRDEKNEFERYLIDHLEIICGKNKMNIKAKLETYFSSSSFGGMFIYVLYNDDDLSMKRRVQDNIKAFTICSIQEDTKIQFRGDIIIKDDIMCYPNGYRLKKKHIPFRPYLNIHYLCGISPILMPKESIPVTKSKTKKISRFLRGLTQSGRTQLQKQRQTKINKSKQRQKKYMSLLPRNDLFKGAGRELLDQLFKLYETEVDFVYLDALNKPPLVNFYKENGFKIVHNERGVKVKRYSDTIAMIKLLRIECIPSNTLLLATKSPANTAVSSTL